MSSSDRPWPLTTLGKLVTLTSGQSPSMFRFGSTGIPYFKVDQLGRSRKYLSRDSTPYFSTQVPQVRAGSVLIAKRGAAIALNRVRIAAQPSFMDTNVMALTPSGALDSEFLYYFLSHRGLWDVADVTSVPQINNKHINPLEIGLPAWGEQRQIAEGLQDADELISTLERLIVKKQAIKQGMMQQLLTGKTRLPGFTEPWSVTSLGALGIFLKGRGVKRDDVRATGTPCIRYGELYTAFNDYTSAVRSFVDAEVAATALPLRSDDLLFAGSGETRDEIGKCVAYVGKTPAIAGGDIVVLRGNAGVFNSIYLALLVNAPNAVDQKSRAGQGDAVVHISSRALAAVEVNVPQRHEQDAIAEVLSDAESEIATLRTKLGKAEDVKAGMMQELFTGRIRLPVKEGAA